MPDFEDVKTFVGENAIPLAVGTGVVALGTGLVIASSIGGKTKKRSRRTSKIKHTSRGWKQDRTRRSKQKWEVAYQKHKKKLKKSRRKGKIHYTKNGQPYVFNAKGQSRFIKGKRRTT